jgi:DNA-binding beta-propeller fold protein YncE
MSTRTAFALFLLVLIGAIALGFGLTRRSGGPDIVWGKKGVQPGNVSRPRAIAIDLQGRLFLVDFTARIQAYDLDGQHDGTTFTTPDFRNGRPSGLSIDRDGNLLVSDSHYHCVRVYTHDGVELKKVGGEAGKAPGQFGYISDCVQDAAGFYYISEFGQNDRITKLDPDGKFIACFGESGQGPKQFARIRALAIGPDGLLYCVDACNHRIQVLTTDGEYVREFGTPGQGPGEFHLPYDLAFNGEGELYVVERGNHRVQKLTKEGVPLGMWGTPGREPGQLADPWAVAVDKKGRVHVVDTENHRVQRVKF